MLYAHKQALAYSILVTGSEIRSCEQISLFHHHQSCRSITTTQQAFDETLRSPFSRSTQCQWLDEKEGGERTRDGWAELKMTDKCKECVLSFFSPRNTDFAVWNRCSCQCFKSTKNIFLNMYEEISQYFIWQSDHINRKWN